MMDAEELIIEKIGLIQRRIKELQDDLDENRAMLQFIQATKRKQGDATMRFYNWRPVDAARVVLEDHGKKMDRSKLIEILVAGGISVGKKRPMVNIRRSFETNIELGNLIEDGEFIDIPR